MGERRAVEKVNGGDNSIDSEDTNPNIRAIHIHGRMEHNLAGYAKYYSCESIEIKGFKIIVKYFFLNIGK
jgi:hypothetical protein